MFGRAEPRLPGLARQPQQARAELASPLRPAPRYAFLFFQICVNKVLSLECYSMINSMINIHIFFEYMV